MTYTLIKCTIIFTLFLLIGVSGVVNAEESLVGFWPLNEGEGQVAKDLSSFDNVGEIYNPQWRKEGKHSFLYFDGDTYVSIPRTENLKLTDQISLEVWVLPDQHDEKYQGIIGDGYWMGSRTEPGFQVVRTSAKNGKAFVQLGGLTEFEFYIPSGKWYHIAFTFNSDTGEVNLYLNGELVKTSEKVSGMLNATNRPIIIGRNPESFRFADGQLGKRGFKGIIRKVRIYNKALSREEVRRHYEEGYLEIGKL